MAGRGRRGSRGGGGVRLEGLGPQEDDRLTAQPPPLFPLLQFQPIKLDDGVEYEHLLEIKHRVKTAMRMSPYFVKPAAVKPDIDRYSDKYRKSDFCESADGLSFNWGHLPDELRPKRKVAVRKKIIANVKLVSGKLSVDVDIDQKLQELEGKELQDGASDTELEEGKAKNPEEDDEEEKEVEDDEFYDEAEEEEGTDYILSYFDNGENYLDDDDDNGDDGPTM